MRPPRHALFHADGRRLLVYGERHGSLDEEAAVADDGAAIHERLDVFKEVGIGIRAGAETALGLFMNDVAPEEAARRLAGIVVPAEPLELDRLCTVTRSEQALR